jgi:hypothetical protein
MTYQEAIRLIMKDATNTYQVESFNLRAQAQSRADALNIICNELLIDKVYKVFSDDQSFWTMTDKDAVALLNQSQTGGEPK